MTLKLAREVDADRITRLDRALLNHTDRGFLVVSAMPPSDHQTHAAHMGRLRKLEDLGLARERQTGVWENKPDMEAKLRSLGLRGDIIMTMHRDLKQAKIDRASGSFAVFDTEKPNNRIVGGVAGAGLTDEINHKHYVVLDGMDGKVHHADIGHVPPELVPERGMIVAVESKGIGEAEQQRTRLRILSYINLGRLVEAEGATWLDKEILSSHPERNSNLDYGSLVQTAVARRQQWLVSQGLGMFVAEREYGTAPNLLAQLRERDLRQANITLSKELGLTTMSLIEGERLSGTYLRPVTLPSGRYAVIQKAKEFVLVPWQREFENTRDRLILGLAGGQGISWDWSGRKRGLEIS